MPFLRPQLVRFGAILFLSLCGGAASSQCLTTWQPTALGSANEGIRALAALPDGGLVAGGRFTTIGGTPANYIARWNGTAWSPMGTGANLFVYALALMPDGSVVAAGQFSTIGGITASRIARWNGAAWQPLGSGVDGTLGIPIGLAINALTVLPNGDLVAGGDFTSIGGVGANRIARWNGSTWSAMGAGLPGSVRALAALPNGDVVAGGALWPSLGNVARWDGTGWQPLGAGLSGPATNALAVTSHGDLVAGGIFATAGVVAANNIARWDGNTWSTLGAGCGGAVQTLHVLPDGDIVAGGAFTTAGGTPCNRIARWDGTAWSSFGNGVDDYVFALAFAGAGQLAVGGAFLHADGVATQSIARIASSCPPSFSTYGSGCTGSGGLVQLQPLGPPVIGGTFRTLGSGLPALAVVAVLVGTTAVALPASLAHPAALPGCSLLVDPNVELRLEFAQSLITVSLAIPSTTTFLGITGYEQIAAIGFDANLSIAEIATSNGVSLTLGSF